MFLIIVKAYKMKIAPYYQKLLAKGVQAIKSGEPISFVGMYDSGETYLFSILAPLVQTEVSKDQIVASVDISGLGDEKKITKSIISAIAESVNLKQKAENFSELTNIISGIARKTRITLSFNLGIDVNKGENFYLMINRLRNLCGWNFSYLFFANTSLITQDITQGAILEKLVRRNIVPIKLPSEPDSEVVISNYEERYGRELYKNTRAKIMELSGGNPGLIKALFIQASENEEWKEANLWDERLYFRLSRIYSDLTLEYQEKLKSIVEGKVVDDEKTISFFRSFDFINEKNEIFSPMFMKYLLNFDELQIENNEQLGEVANTLFSRSERVIVEYLTAHEGEIVDRDQMAKIIWGENWADKYSDWAIDQLMHGIREKLKTVAGVGVIKTKKGEGFIYQAGKEKNEK